MKTIQTIHRTIPHTDMWELSQECLIFLIPLINFVINALRFKKMDRRMNDMAGSCRKSTGGGNDGSIIKNRRSDEPSAPNEREMMPIWQK